MTANNGRPLPWHDTATCERKGCDGPMVPVEAMGNGYSGPAGSRIACAACGEARVGAPDDVAKTRRADEAFHLYQSDLVHTDRGCERCNAALRLDRSRLCDPCVEKDNAERQASLFLEVTY